MTLGLLLLQITWLPLRNWAYLTRYAPFYAVVTAVAAFILWKFWTGRNWARWIVMLMCVGQICMMYQFKTVAPVGRIWLLNQAAFSGVLLYFLNSSAVRSFFISRRLAGAA